MPMPIDHHASPAPSSAQIVRRNRITLCILSALTIGVFGLGIWHALKESAPVIRPVAR